MTTYTEGLSAFAHQTRYSDLSSDAVTATKRLIQDTLACGVAGVVMPSSKAVIDVFGAMGGAPQSSVLVSGQKLPMAQATYINSHLGNAIDSDDTLRYSAHIAASVIAPALAVAEHVNASGEDLISAVAVGYQVGGQIALSLKGMRVGDDGKLQFAPVSGYSYITFAAAVAAGRLLGLNATQMRHAFGLAFASAPMPSSSQFGLSLPRPMTKYALYGALGQGGVHAALLAAKGFTAEPDVLDGERGFWRAMSSTASNWDRLDAKLPDRWLAEDVCYKIYPACRFLNAAIDMFYAISAEQNLRPEEIESIHITLHDAAIQKRMDDPNVNSSVDAFFSAPYLLAAAAYAGEPGPKWHSAESHANKDMHAFARKITVAREPSAAVYALEDIKRLGHTARMPSTISIKARGKTFDAQSDYARGDIFDPAFVLTEAEHNTKFRNYCAGLLPSAQIETALTQLASLERAPNALALIASLTAPAAAERAA